MSRTHTKGNVIIEEIKVGDVHYEYDMGLGIECEVITLPTMNEDGNWTWKSKNLKHGAIIDYLVNPQYSHYSSNLYDYKAYNVKYYI
jgi:hypothetical protein